MKTSLAIPQEKGRRLLVALAIFILGFCSCWVFERLHSTNRPIDAGTHLSLREMREKWENLSIQAARETDADAVEDMHAQQKELIKQMRDEATLSPLEVKPDISTFLSSH